MDIWNSALRKPFSQISPSFPFSFNHSHFLGSFCSGNLSCSFDSSPFFFLAAPAHLSPPALPQFTHLPNNYPIKISVYLQPRWKMSVCLNSLSIYSFSPPSVLQDIRGGNRLLQPLLSNDISGGAVLSQETGGLPLHHPHRRYWRASPECMFLCKHHLAGTPRTPAAASLQFPTFQAIFPLCCQCWRCHSFKPLKPKAHFLTLEVKWWKINQRRGFMKRSDVRWRGHLRSDLNQW